MKAKLLIAGLAVLLMAGFVGGGLLNAHSPPEPKSDLPDPMQGTVDSVIERDGVKVIYCHNTVNNIARYRMAHAVLVGGNYNPEEIRFIYNVTADTNDVNLTPDVDSTNNEYSATATDTPRGSTDTIKTAYLLDDVDSLWCVTSPNMEVASGQAVKIVWTITLN